MTEIQHFDPLIRLATDAYWQASGAEDAASDTCTEMHCDEFGERFRTRHRDGYGIHERPTLCGGTGEFAETHRRTQSALISARAVYDHLNLMKRQHDERASADSLTAVADAVFAASLAEPEGTVSGRSVEEQKAEDARMMRSRVWSG